MTSTPLPPSHLPASHLIPHHLPPTPGRAPLRRRPVRSGLAAATALAAGLTVVPAAGAASAAPVTAGPARAASAMSTAATAATPSYPVVASADRRGLRTSTGAPYTYLADTPWLALNKLTQSGMRTLLDTRKAQGFTTLQMILLGMPHKGSLANAYGDDPLHGMDLARPRVAGGRTTDPSSSAYDYWDHVEWTLDQAEARGMQLNLVPSWYGYNGEDWRGYVTISNAQTYGTFLGKRLGNEKNLMWLLGGDNNPVGDTDRVPAGRDRSDKVTATNRMASAIRAAEPVRHLMSYHAKRPVPSWRYFDDQAWHTYSSAYSRELTYETVGASYARTSPVRPVVMTEAYYDARVGSPRLDRQRLRAQAYWTLLSGGVGFAYGHEHVWDIDSGWRTALSADSARDMQRFESLSDDAGVSSLRPDRGDTRMLTKGYGEAGTRYRAVSARTPGRSLGMAYLPTARTITVNVSALGDGSVRLTWWQPSTGATTGAGTVSTSGSDRVLTTPAGWSDAVLVSRRA